jgi:uncharacterized iron-regulated membrane protein
MSSTATLAQRKSLFWRIHFWAALIASPFAVVAAFTGILYIFTPQIEAQLHGHLDVVQPAGNRQPLDAAIAAAQSEAPAGFQLRYTVPALDAEDSTRVVFAPLDKETGKAMDKTMDKGGEHSGHNMSAKSVAATTSVSAASSPKGEARIGGTERISRNVIVYVNPYTAQVLGQHGEMDRFGMWSKRLHSSLLQGDGWRWLIELSASWLMVMLATGIYLWWPRGSKKALPQAGIKGRMAWAQWHSFIGVALAIMSLVILTTGLTWSKYSGGEIRSLRDMSGQAPPTVPRGLKSTVLPDQTKLTWDSIYQSAKSKAPEVAMQISPPRSADGAWRIANFDRGQPEKRFDMVLDAYSGASLYYSGWDKQTVFGKATAIGIPFHRGEFGWWNQALLLMFGLSVLFSTVTGWVMFYKRRKVTGQFLPRLTPNAWRATPVGAVITAAVFFVIMPLLAWTAAAVAAIEMVLAWRSRKTNIVAA